MELLELIIDRGLASVGGVLPPTSHVIQHLTLGLGDVHKRQRRVMSPAFGLVEVKALYPHFTRCANSVSGYPIQA